jgi:hypothetical protein
MSALNYNADLNTSKKLTTDYRFESAQDFRLAGSGGWEGWFEQ